MNKNNIKKYKLTTKQIAKMFGYSSEYTLRNSTRYTLIIKGIDDIISHVEDEIVGKITR